MKTLLLTLVVMTIVCLDLGYTLICFISSHDSVTCAPGENVCFLKSWCDAWCGSRGKKLSFGCAATCPKVNPGIDIECCSTDNCNPHPKLRP
uniref:Alpha-elapitoxin-Oh2b n=1 Tax=Ophiophagus hannah TaxID=8665 RepID=3L26_OPHHA|nr:RecName: Full=Alpha-elapitoxin-Oh2b; Short=Alpha-EPTX-Oh2b; AltName: Full=Alpha-neurotoxin; AltName: Full=LNTX3; AltName: Full=Long neurotoxin OH-6A/OH-6B; AltName: Full=OH-3; Flags: Precursor [Ophiophagus hannah]AAT97248.1 long chain neurotoxin precursor [Ophiophagus hannah]ABB83622.1 long chain neurotoxin precursor [Ophiophagus hannah]